MPNTECGCGKDIRSRYNQAENQKALSAVRFPIGWFSSGRFVSSSGLISTIWKCPIEDISIVQRVKSRYELD